MTAVPNATATDGRLYAVNEIRAVEQAANARLPPGALMARAGLAAAGAAIALLPDGYVQIKILILAGPGNNGGDALLCALQLRERGINVAVLPLADPAQYAGEAAGAWRAAHDGGVQFIGIDQLTQPWSLIVDGLFGIGLSRALSGAARELVERINAIRAAQRCPVLALDVPSGLDADTGAIVGDGVAIEASHTLTFIGDKPGLHTADGSGHAGVVSVADLAVDAALLPAASMQLNAPALFAACLSPRARNTHKGTFGNVAVIGGADGMAGAPVLAARAAAHCGAGRVFIGFAGAAQALDAMHPELMCRSAADIDYRANTLVVGPGLSTAAAARAYLSQALATPHALVLDADALNLLAADQTMPLQIAQRTGGTLLTPHPLEAARLLGITAAAVQADRIGCARRLARQFQAVAVLKGSGSVIARPDGFVVVNTTGNPALATAGSGDVLSGICGALLAQRWPVWEAALAAVWLHGAAADRLVADGTGPIGLTASELMPAVRLALNTLVREQASL